MRFCSFCRVHPGEVTIKGFPICPYCIGKGIHAVGAIAANLANTRRGDHVFTPSGVSKGHNPATCPPLTHCTDQVGKQYGWEISDDPAGGVTVKKPDPGDFVGTSSTGQNAITLLIGLGLLVATVGVLYMYSDSGSSKSPIKFGFGLQKSPTGR